jgi:hypothetical protein
MKKLALVSALAAIPLLQTAASAQLIDLHLFPINRSATVETLVPSESVQIVQPTVQQTIELPAVVAPTVSTGVQTTSVTTISPPLTDMQIRAMPTHLEGGTAVIESTSTLPAVVDTGALGVVAPVQTVERTMSAIIPPISVGSAVLGLNHMDRLHDMMAQIDLGAGNGMLTADEATSLRASHDRIASLINSLAPGGLTMDEINQIELELNVLNQHISGSMSI